MEKTVKRSICETKLLFTDLDMIIRFASFYIGNKTNSYYPHVEGFD